MSSLEGLRVLLVEDDDDSRDLLDFVLRHGGAHVWSAASVRAALSVFEEARPDVVVSDLSMPEEDGYSLIARLRQRPAARGGRVPAVAVTGYGDEHHRTRALAAGFSEHVTKPVDPRHLCACVARVAHAARPAP